VIFVSFSYSFADPDKKREEKNENFSYVLESWMFFQENLRFLLKLYLLEDREEIMEL
jgi:hypothetical protein